MRVKAMDVMLQPAVREQVSQSLAAGHEVILTADEQEAAALPASHPPEVSRHILVGREAIYGIRTDGSIPIHLPLAAAGGVTGMIVGIGIGAALEQLRAVHPTSALIFDAACAAIGGGAGAAVGVAAGSGLVDGFTLAPAFHGAKVEMGVKLR